MPLKLAGSPFTPSFFKIQGKNYAQVKKSILSELRGFSERMAHISPSVERIICLTSHKISVIIGYIR